MILVISSPADEHAAAVLELLQAQHAAAELVDLSDFPQKLRLSLRHDNDVTRARFVRENGRVVDLDEVTCVWWRRPQPFVIHPSVTREPHRAFALQECHEAVSGLWQCTNARWVNHPLVEQAAARKAHQLLVAREVGLTIPRTLITSDADEAAVFVDGLGAGNTVYKAFSATMTEWRETRLLLADERGLLDAVQYCPVIFQEYIRPGVDLRITVVGRRVFAAAIDVEKSDYPVDFRMDMGQTRIDEVVLERDVHDRILRLMDRLGLSYGAIDMRRDPHGRHVFFEVNPSGQWLFIEQRTRQPITRAVADLLLGAPPPS